MPRLLWLCQDRLTDPLRAALAGWEITEATRLEEGLIAVGEQPFSVAVVAADDPESPGTIMTLKGAKVELQVVAAAHEVTRPVHAALRAGAASIIDLHGEPAQIARQLLDASIDYELATGEHELLLRLRALNEEFLKNMVAVEQRNIELSEKLEETSRLAAGDFSLLIQEGEPRKERILVVDDEETICDLVTMTLSGQYDVESVLDATAAVGKMAEKPYHLVITDKNLPGMTGLELMAAVKKDHPDTDVLMMTGYASKESAIEALNLGASAYLEKPFDLAALNAAVDSVIARSRDRLRKRHYLQVIKERNASFLQQYKQIRTDLESWLALRGVRIPTRTKQA